MRDQPLEQSTDDFWRIENWNLHCLVCGSRSTMAVGCATSKWEIKWLRSLLRGRQRRSWIPSSEKTRSVSGADAERYLGRGANVRRGLQRIEQQI